MKKFSGKRVLITGASRGIGRHLALDFAAEGACVGVNFHQSQSAAEDVVKEIITSGGDAFAVQADIAIPEQVQAMFAEIRSRMGGVDVLVNNAGINRDGPFLQMSEDDWDTVIATNLKGPFLCSQAAAGSMMSEKSASGRIINISAITSLVGRGNASNYSASKAGLNSLTRSLAVELGPDITVNAIALGFFESPLVHEVFTADQIAEVQAKLPVGRMGKLNEVSALVLYLASDAAAFLTGEVISLDGGQFISMS